MRRFVVTSLLLALLSAASLAQELPIKVRRAEPGTAKQRQRKSAQVKTVPVPQKLWYICKQLGLSEKQRQQAEGLLAVLETEIQMSSEEMVERLKQIRAVLTERNVARADGDAERAAELSRKLASLAPGLAAEKKFVEGLMAALDDAQKAKFQTLLEQLKGVTDLSLKPIQVVRLARKFELNAEQQEKLKQLRREFRKAIGQPGADGATLLDKLIADAGAILDADQRVQFEQRIDQLRLDPPPAKPAQRTAPHDED